MPRGGDQLKERAPAESGKRPGLLENATTYQREKIHPTVKVTFRAGGCLFLSRSHQKKQRRKIGGRKRKKKNDRGPQ